MCRNNWLWGIRKVPVTVSFDHHSYRWSSTFRTLAFWGKLIVANSRLADLLNKARLSCHRQARWFLVPGKWEARSRGKFYSSTRSFVSRCREQSSTPPELVFHQSKKCWPWHARCGNVWFCGWTLCSHWTKLIYIIKIQCKFPKATPSLQSCSPPNFADFSSVISEQLKEI